jgi:hypothetical protein
MPHTKQAHVCVCVCVYIYISLWRLMTYIHTAPLTSRCFILYIYSTNIVTEYFKRAAHSPHFSLQNAVCFIMLPFLVPVLFTFYIYIYYVTISGPQIFEHKRIQTVYLWIYITKKHSHHTFGQRIWICVHFKHLNHRQQESLPPASSYTNSHCTYTLVLHVCMYVHVLVTVLTPW